MTGLEERDGETEKTATGPEESSALLFDRLNGNRHKNGTLQ